MDDSPEEPRRTERDGPDEGVDADDRSGLALEILLMALTTLVVVAIGVLFALVGSGQ